MGSWIVREFESFWFNVQVRGFESLSLTAWGLASRYTALWSALEGTGGEGGWKRDDGRWKMEDGRGVMGAGGWKMGAGGWALEDGW